MKGMPHTQRQSTCTYIPQVQVGDMAARLKGAGGVGQPQGGEQLAEHLLFLSMCVCVCECDSGGVGWVSCTATGADWGLHVPCW